MRFVQNFTPPEFQAKTFALNFNSFSDKNTKKMSEKLRNLHCLQKIYTAAGIDGMDKSHLWTADIK